MNRYNKHEDKFRMHCIKYPADRSRRISGQAYIVSLDHCLYICTPVTEHDFFFSDFKFKCPERKSCIFASFHG